MLRRSYDALISLAAGPRAGFALALVAFVESSFFPIPPDALLLPMCLARPRRAYHYAALCTIFSVIGGMFGYFIGATLYDTIGIKLIHAYHLENAFAVFTQQYAKWGIWVILIKGMTPIPYKLVTISAGMARFNFPLFVMLSIITRGARFFLIAALLRARGEQVRGFVEKRLTLVTSTLAVLIVGGFVALRYL